MEGRSEAGTARQLKIPEPSWPPSSMARPISPRSSHSISSEESSASLDEEDPAGRRPEAVTCWRAGGHHLPECFAVGQKPAILAFRGVGLGGDTITQAAQAVRAWEALAPQVKLTDHCAIHARSGRLAPPSSQEGNHP